MAKDKSAGADASVQNKAPEGGKQVVQEQPASSTDGAQESPTPDLLGDISHVVGELGVSARTDAILKAIGPVHRGDGPLTRLKESEDRKAIEHDGELLARLEELHARGKDSEARALLVAYQGKSEWVYILEAVKHDGKLLAVGDEVEMSTADALALVNSGAAALVESPKDS